MSMLAITAAVAALSASSVALTGLNCTLSYESTDANRFVHFVAKGRDCNNVTVEMAQGRYLRENKRFRPLAIDFPRGPNDRYRVILRPVPSVQYPCGGIRLYETGFTEPIRANTDPKMCER